MLRTDTISLNNRVQEAYGPDGWSSSGQTLYTGEYQLRAEEL